MHLLEYEANVLKPVAACVARTHAMMGLPQTAAYADDLPHIETVEELIGYLNIVAPGTVGGSTAVWILPEVCECVSKNLFRCVHAVSKVCRSAEVVCCLT